MSQVQLRHQVVPSCWNKQHAEILHADVCSCMQCHAVDISTVGDKLEGDAMLFSGGRGACLLHCHG